MAKFSILVEFEVDADDHDSAETVGRQIIEAVLMEDIIDKADNAKVQDIEMIDDDEIDEIDFNEDDE